MNDATLNDIDSNDVTLNTISKDTTPNNNKGFLESKINFLHSKCNALIKWCLRIKYPSFNNYKAIINNGVSLSEAYRTDKRPFPRNTFKEKVIYYTIGFTQGLKLKLILLTGTSTSLLMVMSIYSATCFLLNEPINSLITYLIIIVEINVSGMFLKPVCMGVRGSELI
eukprot:jgi/Orpsp1_1/1188225/evm.model.d7180000063312.1